MPKYAALVKFTAQELRSMGDPEKAYDELMKIAAQMGVKLIGAYSILGPYDLMLLYEAPDEKVVVGMGMACATKWGGTSETWTLIPFEEFAKLVARLKG